MALTALQPNTPLVKQYSVASALPGNILSQLGDLVALMPALDSILGTLVARVGATHINWDVLIKVVMAAIPGGPQAVILAILTNLGSILATPQAHAIPVAQQLVAQAELHGSP
jgi:hypothetical protein